MPTSPQEIQTYQRRLLADPEFQRLMADTTLDSRQKSPRIGAILQRLGQPPEGYFVGLDGQVQKKSPGWEKYLGPAIAAAGGAGLAALGAAPAALGASETATTLGATGGLVPGLATVAAPAASGVIAPTAAGFSWGKLAPTLLGLGTQAVGSYLSQRAASKAADQQSEAADKALQLQRDIFTQSQANQRPFIDAGTGAITRLNSLMGGSPLASQQQAAPQQQQQAQQQPQMVQMRAPDGSVKAVPYTEVPHWESLKAVRVF